MSMAIVIREWEVYIGYRAPIISIGAYKPIPSYICDQLPIVHQTCFELHTTKGELGTNIYIMNNNIVSIEFVPILLDNQKDNKK